MLEKKLLFIFFLFLLTDQTVLFAQLDQPKRIEIELEKYNEDPFNIISLKENGIMLFRELRKREIKKHNTWQIIKYDTLLEKKWEKKCAIDMNYSLANYAYYKNKAYLLLKKGEQQTGDFKVLTIDLNKGDTTLYNIQGIIPIQIVSFSALEKNIILAGYANYRPILLHYELSKEKPQVLRGFYQPNSKFLEIKTNPEDNTFNVVSLEKKYNQKLSHISVKTFDENGTLLKGFQIDPKNNNSFLSGRSTFLKKDRVFVAGTYSRKGATMSRGIFLAYENLFNEQGVTYINYADLENFFNYMKEKRRERIKKRIKKKKNRGKKIRFNYRLLTHEIIEKDDKFYFLGEAYYPKYYNNVTRNYNRMGIPARITTNFLFVEYQYTHAVIICFDKQGNLLWDNTFKINDIATNQLQKMVHLVVENDHVVLLYLHENELHSKVIQNNEVISDKTFDEIKLSFEDDIVKNIDHEVSGLEEWYGKYFFTYGVQNIKNLKDTNVKLNRKVFFVNKIFINK